MRAGPMGPSWVRSPHRRDPPAPRRRAVRLGRHARRHDPADLPANVVVLRELGIDDDPRVVPRALHARLARARTGSSGIPEHRWDAVGARWGEEMANGRPRALPWARPALRRLRAHGVRVGLVTASTARRRGAQPRAASTSTACSRRSATRDDVARSKPHPDALLEALEELGVPAGDTVYVGDTTVDLEMARPPGRRSWPWAGRRARACSARTASSTVWPGVGAWADDLLGTARHRNGSERHGSPRGRRP